MNNILLRYKFNEIIQLIEYNKGLIECNPKMKTLRKLLDSYITYDTLRSLREIYDSFVDYRTISNKYSPGVIMITYENKFIRNFKRLIAKITGKKLVYLEDEGCVESFREGIPVDFTPESIIEHIEVCQESEILSYDKSRGHYIFQRRYGDKYCPELDQHYISVTHREDAIIRIISFSLQSDVE